MILLTPREAAEEFPISERAVRYWAEHGRIRSHPRDDNARPQRGGWMGYRVERAQVAEQVRRVMARRAGRRSPSPATPQPPTAPRPTSPPPPGGE